MAQFSKQWSNNPGDGDYDYIAHCVGTIVSPTTDPNSYLVLWDWFDDLGQTTDDQFEWHVTDMVPA